MASKKIVIIGPESTGKSSLCTLLAAHFNTVCVYEYAREYLLKNGTNYKVQDLYTIAVGQTKLEEEGIDKLRNLNANAPLIIDTNLEVIRVWSEFVFAECDNRILTSLAASKYDLYLLCKNDLPWVKDELREYPDNATREKLFHHYKQLAVTSNIPFVIIEGNYDQRLQLAIKAVQEIL